ncbi:R-linalool synthase QH1, chloroplastic [Lactuca sativa]|nr:R-linalool synthase QH1, chloroplastic [Lactuca sativa]
MALVCLFSISTPLCYKTSYAKRKGFNIYNTLYSSQSNSVPHTMAQPLVRRSANYEPSLWSFDHIQSLSINYKGNDYTSRRDSLIEAVKALICNVRNPLSVLELIDDLQRLGIAYHFPDEICSLLEMIYHNYYQAQDTWNSMSLNHKALGFRLLRQHGYHVPQEIFGNFEDQTQNLKPHLYEDMMCILNLYEASYNSFENESIMDDARDFTARYLKENLENIHENLSSLVTHALELPLHWRVPRVEAIWYIEEYEKRNGMNPTLLELAKLDFNMVQAIHLEDLKHSSRWWRNICWDKKLCFARDRLVENFLWTVGVNYLPHLTFERKTLLKVFAILTTIDDVYDVYGTLDELNKFTDAVNRWDINLVGELPDYMKICFLGFYNSINQMSYNALTRTGFLILPYVKKTWTDLCNSFLLEAQWYHSGYIPTLEEYLENGYVSIGASVILMHLSFLTSINVTEEIMQGMEGTENIVRYSSLIVRLADDLATSSDEIARGDNPKSIQCYMHENGATEEEARRYIELLLIKTWKKLNKARAGAKSQFSQEFNKRATNLARMAHFMYSNGDGHGRPDLKKSHVISLLFNPILGIE